MYKEKHMSKARAVLEVIKDAKGNGGMSKLSLSLSEAQVEDYENLKKSVEIVDEKVTDMQKNSVRQEGKLDMLSDKVNTLVKQNEKPSIITLCYKFLDYLKHISEKLISSRYFWACVVIYMVLVLGSHLDLADILKSAKPYKGYYK